MLIMFNFKRSLIVKILTDSENIMGGKTRNGSYKFIYDWIYPKER
jgi:hypothetical protein